MPEDTSNPFAAMIGALASKGGEKGVRKDSEGKVSPHLTPAEKSRYEKIFSVMKDIVNPGPEAGQLDTKLEKEKEAGGAGGAMNMLTKDLGGGIGKYSALIGAGLATAALAFVSDKESLMTMALKLTKFLPIKMLKGLPLVGSLLNFGFAYQAFQDNKPGKGLWELTSGIAGLFPGWGTAISIGMDMVMYMFEQDEAAAEEEGKKIDFGTWLKDRVVSIGTSIFTNLKDGKIPLLSGFYKFGEGLGHFFVGDWDEGLKSWEAILPSFFGMGSDQNSFWDGLNSMVQMVGDGVGGAWDTASEWAGDAWGWVKDFFSDVGDVLSSFFDSIKNFVSDSLNNGKRAINDKIGWDLFDVEPTAEEKAMAEKVRKNEEEGKKRTAAFNWRKEQEGAGEWNKNTQLHLINDGEGSREERLKQKHKFLDDTVKLFEAHTKKQNLANVAAFHKELAEARARDEVRYAMEADRSNKAYGAGAKALQDIEDGIVHQNGRATRIDGNDAGLFAKAGGPIDKMLDQNSAVMKSIASINAQQLNVLVEIREGIKSLGQGGGLSFNNAPLAQEFFE